MNPHFLYAAGQLHQLELREAARQSRIAASARPRAARSRRYRLTLRTRGSAAPVSTQVGIA